MAYVEVFSRCVIGVVFLVSAWSKRPGSFTQFSDSLAAMRLLPARAVVPVAGVVVALETVVVLLMAVLPAPGLALAVVLLLGFAASIAVVLRRGVQASCRCFGGSGAAPFRVHHIVRNLVLVAVAVAGLVAVLAGPAPTWQAVALGAVPGSVVALLVTRLDDLVELFAPTPPVPVRRR